MARAFFCPQATTSERAPSERLSVRDRRILRLHAEGRTPVQIACGLLCDVNVVRTVIEAAAVADELEQDAPDSAPPAPAEAAAGVAPLALAAPASQPDTFVNGAGWVTEHGADDAVRVSSLETPAGALVASDAPAAFSRVAPTVQRGTRNHIVWTDEILAFIADGRGDGVPFSAIASALGVNPSTVEKAHYRNILGRKRAASQDPLAPDADTAVDPSADAQFVADCRDLLAREAKARKAAIPEDASRSAVRGGRRPNPQGGNHAPAPTAGRAAAPAVSAPVAGTAPVVPTIVPAVAARRGKATQSSPGTAPPSEGLGPGADDGHSIPTAGAAPTAQAPAAPLSAVPLAEVAPCGCRWPVSDDRPHLFCNARAVEGRPYCAEHVAVAYVPLQPRRMFNPDRQLF